MSKARDELYARFTKARAGLTVIGNMLQSDPATPRMHTAEDVTKWPKEAQDFSAQLDQLFTDTYAYLERTAGPTHRL